MLSSRGRPGTVLCAVTVLGVATLANLPSLRNRIAR